MPGGALGSGPGAGAARLRSAAPSGAGKPVRRQPGGAMECGPGAGAARLRSAAPSGARVLKSRPRPTGFGARSQLVFVAPRFAKSFPPFIRGARGGDVAGPIARLAGQDRPQAESAVCPCHPPLPPLIKGGKKRATQAKGACGGSSPRFSTRQSRAGNAPRRNAPWRAGIRTWGWRRQATICRPGRGWERTKRECPVARESKGTFLFSQATCAR